TIVPYGRLANRLVDVLDQPLAADHVVQWVLGRAAQVSVIDHVAIARLDERVIVFVWMAGAGDFLLEFPQRCGVAQIMNTLEREGLREFIAAINMPFLRSVIQLVEDCALLKWYSVSEPEHDVFGAGAMVQTSR